MQLQNKVIKKVERILTPSKDRKRRTLLLSAVLCLSFLGGFILPAETILAAGFSLTIPTVPVNFVPATPLMPETVGVDVAGCSVHCWGQPAAKIYLLFASPATVQSNNFTDASQGINIPISQLAVVINTNPANVVSIQPYGSTTPAQFDSIALANQETKYFIIHFKMNLMGDEDPGVYATSILITAVQQ